MLKSERQKAIVDLTNQFGAISVKSIQEELKVSDMTIRRDLTELEHGKKLVRVHGGAQSVTYGEVNESGTDHHELSHLEKKNLRSEEKHYIAKKAAQLIDSPDETIFLGPGTTIELMTEYLNHASLRIVTNSLPVFNLLKDKEGYELYLIGGSYRKRTGAFVGLAANEMIQKIGITKAFIGVNGIDQQFVSTFNVEEGEIQKLALDKAAQKILVADANKFDYSDFYNFYDLNQIDMLFTDYTISADVKKRYQAYTTIIN
ncbi:DeoR/GlpR family DNA-binding transcription regulator [Enterococcus sp. LJL90]